MIPVTHANRALYPIQAMFPSLFPWMSFVPVMGRSRIKIHDLGGRGIRRFAVPDSGAFNFGTAGDVLGCMQANVNVSGQPFAKYTVSTVPTSHFCTHTRFKTQSLYLTTHVYWKGIGYNKFNNSAGQRSFSTNLATYTENTEFIKITQFCPCFMVSNSYSVVNGAVSLHDVLSVETWYQIFTQWTGHSLEIFLYNEGTKEWQYNSIPYTLGVGQSSNVDLIVGGANFGNFPHWTSHAYIYNKSLTPTEIGMLAGDPYLPLRRRMAYPLYFLSGNPVIQVLYDLRSQITKLFESEFDLKSVIALEKAFGSDTKSIISIPKDFKSDSEVILKNEWVKAYDTNIKILNEKEDRYDTDVDVSILSSLIVNFDSLVSISNDIESGFDSSYKQSNELIVDTDSKFNVSIERAALFNSKVSLFTELSIENDLSIKASNSLEKDIDTKVAILTPASILINFDSLVKIDSIINRKFDSFFSVKNLIEDNYDSRASVKFGILVTYSSDSKVIVRNLKPIIFDSLVIGKTIVLNFYDTIFRIDESLIINLSDFINSDKKEDIVYINLEQFCTSDAINRIIGIDSTLVFFLKKK